MSKLFFVGTLLAGFGLCIGCTEPTTAPQGDAATDSPAYEQQMTGAAETSTEAEAPAAEEPAAEAPAAEAPAAEAPAAEAPAAEAPAAEAPAAPAAQ